MVTKMWSSWVVAQPLEMYMKWSRFSYYAFLVDSGCLERPKSSQFQLLGHWLHCTPRTCQRQQLKQAPVMSKHQGSREIMDRPIYHRVKKQIPRHSVRHSQPLAKTNSKCGQRLFLSSCANFQYLQRYQTSRRKGNSSSSRNPSVRGFGWEASSSGWANETLSSGVSGVKLRSPGPLYPHL